MASPGVKPSPEAVALRRWPCRFCGARPGDRCVATSMGSAMVHADRHHQQKQHEIKEARHA